MSTIVQLSIFPVDKGDHLSPYVARALGVIRDSGLPYELGAMGTCIEGEWSEVMAVVSNCFDALKADCNRIIVNIKADYKKTGSGRMSSKVDSVRDKM